MEIEHVLAAVPVRDLTTARDWYTRLFDREPDNNPMDTLAEWRVTDSGWVQVYRSDDGAGATAVNFAVTDLDGTVEELRERGVKGGEITEASKGVRLCAFVDPDGNTVTLIGGFRVVY